MACCRTSSSALTPMTRGVWQIVAGERRYRALQHLLTEEGKLEPDYPVPTTIKEVSDFELLMLATTENCPAQRHDTFRRG